MTPMRTKDFSPKQMVVDHANVFDARYSAANNFCFSEKCFAESILSQKGSESRQYCADGNGPL
jgi:hypothetical protein